VTDFIYLMKARAILDDVAIREIQNCEVVRQQDPTPPARKLERPDIAADVLTGEGSLLCRRTLVPGFS
jgi:hypothetical protein